MFVWAFDADKFVIVNVIGSLSDVVELVGASVPAQLEKGIRIGEMACTPAENRPCRPLQRT